MGNDVRDLSLAALAKREAAVSWRVRVRETLGDRAAIDNLEALERRFEGNLEWLGVVHADGNGLGEILLNFDRVAGTDNREYADLLREFSDALDRCTQAAFRSALGVLSESGQVLPLVLGGDDMTAIVDGRQALRFTRAFLRAFEAASSEGVVSEVARQALPTARLSACAGVAIVKPHFPFFSAYELSEQLLKSAKSVKRHVRSGGKAFPCSAMDFHPLYDASFTDLTDIRKRLVVDDGRTRPIARPYVVSELSELPDAVTGRDWAEAHQWEGLKDRVAALGRRNSEGRQELPNSQTHDLRGALFAGRAAAEARFRLLLGRFPAFAKAAEGARLFRSAVETSDTFETRFLDAMEASEFWEGQEP